jgi:hypothetical protein
MSEDSEISMCISIMNAPLTEASGIRRARTYAKVERVQGDSDDYPVGCSTFLNSIHDARYY